MGEVPAGEGEEKRVFLMLQNHYILIRNTDQVPQGKNSGCCQGKKNRQEGGEMGEVSCRRGGGKSSIRVFPFSHNFFALYNNCFT